jgi:hypothetical protein
MAIEMDEIVKARLGDELEKELKKNANFLQKQLEWRDAANRFEGMVSMTHEQWLALQEIEEVFLEYNASYGEAAYRQGLSDGISIGVEQEADGRKSVLALEDMTNLISVYDAIRQLKKVLLGRMDEHWEDAGAFRVFEYVFNVIDNATCSKIQFLGKDEAIEVVTGVLDDETMEPGEKARLLLGME